MTNGVDGSPDDHSIDGRRRNQTSAEDARVARTRADVSAAALEVLTTEGWDAVTHATVARVAGYSKTTLYTHWPSRVDLLGLALDVLGEMPHHTPTGDLRADLIGEMTVFRDAVLSLRLDRILLALAHWGATEDDIARVRTRLVADGESVVRTVLGRVAGGTRLDAAVAMFSGAVICPVLMYGETPTDEVVAAAVDIVLHGVATD